MHQNYVGCDVDKEPFLLSVVVTDANNHNVPQYRAILWKKTVSWNFRLSAFTSNSEHRALYPRDDEPANNKKNWALDLTGEYFNGRDLILIT